jgi:hypothetical protein
LLRNRGLVAARRGRDETIQDDLAAAMQAFERLGYPYWLAHSQTDVGAWLIDRERPGDAQGLLEDAGRAFTRLGAAPAAERVRLLVGSESSFDGMPVESSPAQMADEGARS